MPPHLFSYAVPVHLRTPSLVKQHTLNANRRLQVHVQ